MSTRVALLRTLPEEGLRSIERFGDELEAALRAGEQVEPFGFAPPGRPRGGRLRRSWRRFVSYPRALRKVEAEVFHILDQGYAHLVRALPAERTIVTCHDLTPLRMAEGDLPIEIGRAVLARYTYSVRHLGDAARVACPSGATRADLIRLLGIDPDRIAVIPNGLDPRFRPLEPERVADLRSGLGGDGPLILHVDSGMSYKNPAGVLRVLAKLREGGIPARLVRAGAALGPAEARLAAELGVADAVVEAGMVDDERLIELYAAADMLLFPSHYEGFGWPPLEAMACGTPVVISKAPALLETAGAAALRADADDVDGLAAAAAQILTDDELAERLSKAGRAHMTRYSWQRTAAAYADLYREIAAD